MKKERGLWELYESDPEKAHAEIWDGESGIISRRGFVKRSALATLSLFIGAHIPFLKNIRFSRLIKIHRNTFNHSKK